MMSAEQLTAAPAGSARTTAQIPSAAQLAGRIQIPRRLPPRYDGQPLEHLSHSSYNRFVLCPEDWRRRYMLGEKTVPSGSMFLGRQVDDAITLYYRHILDHGERLSVDQVKDAFWDGWKAAAEGEREQLGIAWETDLREDSAFKLGLDAVELTFSELIPHLGEPVAVQRQVEYTLAPGLEWLSWVSGTPSSMSLNQCGSPSSEALSPGRRRCRLRLRDGRAQGRLGSAPRCASNCPTRRVRLAACSLVGSRLSVRALDS